MFCNFLSEIRNKIYKVCGGTNKLPNAKYRNVLPTKWHPVNFFFKIFRRKTEKLCILQKKITWIKILFFFTFYIYVPNFTALKQNFQTDLVLLNLLRISSVSKEKLPNFVYFDVHHHEIHYCVRKNNAHSYCFHYI